MICYYVGARGADGTCHIRVISQNGEETDLDPRLDVCNHSPAGFQWGYGGSGPAQTALAILCHHLQTAGVLDPAQAAQCDYQSFKRHVVCALPESWEMDGRVVMEFLLTLNQEEQNQPVSWPLFRASITERGLLRALRGKVTIRAN